MNAPMQAPDPKKKLRCIVVQLARLGDTLQSLMALRAAQQLYPNLEIHFVARERFADAVKRVPWITRVIPLPTESLLAPILAGKKRELDSLGDIARWIAPLVSEPWDFVVNWSYSEASSYLTGLLPGRVKLGYSRRKDTTFSSCDGWSHYIQAIVQSGVNQNIHLTDILTTQLLTALQIHAGEPENNGDSPVTSKSFFTLSLEETKLGWGGRDLTKKWIAIQLGAGRESKTWAPENWAALSRLILKNHPEYNIVLLGGNEDKERMKTLREKCPENFDDNARIVSLVGETDFDLWASVISRCQWLFAGDTAAIHLASVLGTRVMNVSVGPVRWVETGPYGNGHYVISSSSDIIAPEIVYGTWSYALNDWNPNKQLPFEEHFDKLGYASHAHETGIYRSKIRSTENGGGIQYESLIRKPMDLDEWSTLVMGHIARAWYCGWVPPVGQDLTRDRINTALVKKLRELLESSDAMVKICDEARKTAVVLQQKSAGLRSNKVMGVQDREEIQELGKKLRELDLLIERLGQTHSPLRAFAQMSKVLMHNLRGDDLCELGQESASSYRQLSEGVSILREWTKSTLNMAKPMALKATRPMLKEISP